MYFQHRDNHTNLPLSGTQFELVRGDQRALIASVGASLRSYTVAGRNLVLPYDADELRPAYRGATVAPWPNRVVDGAYHFAGGSYQLPLNEVGRGHALHGFTPWQEFAPRDQAESFVTLAAQLVPQAGYPWRIEIETTYLLDDRGLTQRVVATNIGEGSAPYGVCPHPYLTAGDGRIDEWELTLSAASVLEVTPDRLIPTQLASVSIDPLRFDFRSGRRIGDSMIDHAYTDLKRDSTGLARVELRAGKTGVVMTWDEHCSWLQIHTADLGDASIPGHRAGLAVEPMTCAPNAFNSGSETGLVTLAPGELHEASWTIAPL